MSEFVFAAKDLLDIGFVVVDGILKWQDKKSTNYLEYSFRFGGLQLVAFILGQPFFTHAENVEQVKAWQGALGGKVGLYNGLPISLEMGNE